MPDEESRYPPEWKGMHDVEFITGLFTRINIYRCMVTSQGVPIYIQDIGGKRYNWLNILWIKKVSE